MIKKIIFAILLSTIVIGVIKDKFIDTPQNCNKKLATEITRVENNNVDIFNLNTILVYKIYFWSLIPMGEMKFSFKTTDTENIFSLEAITKDSIAEKFIVASARIESYFDKNSRLPIKYVEVTEVNGKKKIKEIFFDHINLIATLEDKKIKIKENVYDPVGAFIYMLSNPLIAGKTNIVKLLSKRELYDFKTDLLSKNDAISEILIDVKREDLTSSHGAKFHAWLTDGNIQIPLAFKSWTPAGYVSVVLDRIE